MSVMLFTSHDGESARSREDEEKQKGRVPGVQEQQSEGFNGTGTTCRIQDQD